MKYPREWLGFYNSHIRENVEVVGITPPDAPFLRDLFEVRHLELCATCERDEGFGFAEFRDMEPLTPAARAMLAIAKAGAK
ncbi:MAG TPA: hypothetical protein VN623_11560 [Hyphomicrobium sp.]|uniref:hypothetical protein n=1 Tax=Hyphomicrobium sp. TaxID=82 RepID=UPI002B5A8B33|nr:hypothetical protein [Hyphomicrobium sp.]HXE02573.1 hypothetical protein [Hyphomicrobium sp.]